MCDTKSVLNFADQDRLDPELLELAMSDIPNEKQLPKPSEAITKLLATIKKSSSSNKKVETSNNEELSEEANKVLGKLHDLSYMRSTVLMFPVTMQEGVITSK